MTFEELKQHLMLQNQQFQLTTQTLDGAFQAFLSSYYFKLGKVLEIDNATLVHDDANQAVLLTGRSAFLEVPNLETEARFHLDSDSQPQVCIRYTLVKSWTQTDKWKFSNSFPYLPSEVISRLGSSEFEPLLDDLQFTQAHYYVSSAPCQATAYDLSLEPGISFASKIKPIGFLGVLENLLPDIQPVILSGSIVMLPDDTTLPLPSLNVDVTALEVYPWEMDSPALPGIHLNIDFDLGFKVGNASLHDTKFHMYAPLSKSMTMQDAMYAPVNALTATFDIPSADMSVNMIALIKPQVKSLSFEARLDRFSIGNLTKLADACGSLDIPDKFDQFLKPLKKLELTNFGFMISWDNRLTFDQIAFGIGIPDANWHIWQDDLVLSGIGAQFILHSPFKYRFLETNLWGIVDIDGSPLQIRGTVASHQLMLMAQISDADLPLKPLMKKIAPDVPPPSDLNISELQLMLIPGQSYRISGSLMQKPKAWTVNIGPTPLTISDVFFELSHTQSDGFAGYFNGNLAIGDNFTLAINYALPGDLVLRGEVNVFTLKSLVKNLTNQPLNIPKGLDFEILDASAVIQKSAGNMMLQLAGRIEGLGFIALEVRKIRGKWGIAIGISLNAGTKLSHVKGLGDLKAIEKIVELEDLLIAISTYDGPQFRFPDMAAFSNPVLSEANVELPKTAGGLVTGLNVYSQWRIDTHKKELKLLKGLLGLDPVMAMTLQVSNPPTKSSMLYTSMETKFDGKWPFKYQVGVALNNKVPEIFVAGKLQVKLNKRPYKFDVAMSIVQSGAYFSGSMVGTVKIKNLQFSNLLLASGVNWAGVPSLGISANLDIGKVSSSITFFFDANNPSKSVFAGSLSDLNLKDIAVSVAGAKKVPDELAAVLKQIKLKGTGQFKVPAKASKALANSLNELDYAKIAAAFQRYGKINLPTTHDQLNLVIKKKGSLWSITDMTNQMRHYQVKKVRSNILVSVNSQIYYAPQSTQIGALTFTEGFYLGGSISVLGLTSTTVVEISQSKGIAVDTTLNKNLVIYKKSFFYLGAADKKTQGARLSLSTFAQPKHKIKALRKPHFYLNGKLVLMGITSSGIITVTRKGFEFDLYSQRPVPVPAPLSGKIHHTLEGSGYFSSTGQLGTSLQNTLAFDTKINFGELGKLKFKANVTGTVSASFNGKEAKASFKGSFTFKKKRHSVKLTLKADSKDLANMGKLVAKEVERIFTDVFDSAEEWAKFAADGFMEGIDSIEDTAKVLDKTFKKSAKEVAKSLKNAGHDAEKVGKALKNAFDLDKDDLKSALKGAGYASKEVDKFVSSAFKSLGKEAKKAGKKIKKLFK